MGESPSLAAPSRHKVLVVDDEQENLDFVKRVLRRKYDVVCALSGAEALERVRGERFAAIISDQLMPGVKGTRLLAEARRLDPHAVRLLLTGYAAEEDSMEAINEAHIFSFLAKPVSSDVMSQAVDEAVRAFELATQNRLLAENLAARTRELEATRENLQNALASRTRELEGVRAQLHEGSFRDLVTGLANHREFHERLGQELARAARFGEPLTVVLLDVDDFAAYNAAHGHAEGDRLLCAIAERLQAGPGVVGVREMDLVARWGGDEFAFLLARTTIDEARPLCQRLALLGEAPFAGVAPWPSAGRLTITCGLAEGPRHGARATELVDTAWAALRRAKQAGRAGVGVAE